MLCVVFTVNNNSLLSIVLNSKVPVRTHILFYSLVSGCIQLGYQRIDFQKLEDLRLLLPQPDSLNLCKSGQILWEANFFLSSCDIRFMV